MRRFVHNGRVHVPSRLNRWVIWVLSQIVQCVDQDRDTPVAGVGRRGVREEHAVRVLVEQ